MQGKRKRKEDRGAARNRWLEVRESDNRETEKKVQGASAAGKKWKRKQG